MLPRERPCAASQQLGAVRQLVRPKVRALEEGVATLRAFVRLCRRVFVRLQMPREMRPLAEPFSACVLTAERFCVRVSQPVGFEVPTALERLGAVGARERMLELRRLLWRESFELDSFRNRGRTAIKVPVEARPGLERAHSETRKRLQVR